MVCEKNWEEEEQGLKRRGEVQLQGEWSGVDSDQVLGRRRAKQAAWWVAHCKTDRQGNVDDDFV